jgi:hypothetical protein
VDVSTDDATWHQGDMLHLQGRCIEGGVALADYCRIVGRRGWAERYPKVLRICEDGLYNLKNSSAIGLPMHADSANIVKGCQYQITI